MLLPTQMMPQRFDEKSGTMVPDPKADTAKELERLKAFQAANPGLAAQRMPPMRSTAKALQRRTNERARAQAPAATSLADLKAGRAARSAAQRASSAQAVSKTDGQLEAALAELEQNDATIADLRAHVAELEAKIAASSAPTIIEIRDMVSALLDHALEQQHAATAAAAATSAPVALDFARRPDAPLLTDKSNAADTAPASSSSSSSSTATDTHKGVGGGHHEPKHHEPKHHDSKHQHHDKKHK